MRKFILGLSLTVSSVFCLNAQQDPQFTQFFYNKLIMNPAYAGSKNAICVTLLNRSQWVGYDGAPNSTLISFDMPLPVFQGTNNEIAVGLTSYMDFIGFEKNYALRIAGTYRRKNLGPGDLAAGIDIGFSNKGIEAPIWNPPSTPNDPGIPPSASNLNDFGFDFGFGLYYNSSQGATNDWYVGVSAVHLTGSQFKSINIRQARTMYIMGGYTFNFAGTDWGLNPNALIKTDFATAQFDVNANVIWRQSLWGGLTYRVQDAVAINVGLSMGLFSQNPFLRGLQVSYSYDINTSRLNSYNSGSHEIVLRYCFSLTKNPVMIPHYGVRNLDANRDRIVAPN